MHRVTLKFLCLNSYGHAPAIGETIKECKIACVCVLVSRIH